MSDRIAQASAEEEVYLFPLSHAQERLWFMEQLQGASALYNLSNAYRVRFQIDPDLLERSLNEVVRRHELLRTAFRTVQGNPMQVVAAELRIPVPLTDLSSLSAHQREGEAARLAAEEARRPFDLATLPLLRVRLLRLRADDWVLVMTMHHIVSDGWSIVVLWREVRAIAEAYGAGRPSPLAELPIQYGDYAAWQREWLRGAAVQRQLDYWRKQLKGARLLQVPSDRPRPELQTNSGALFRFSLPRSLISSLDAIRQKTNATLFMVLVAAFQVLLHRYTGDTDVIVGSYIAGRNRAEIEQLIGLFTNPIVLRLNLSGDPGFLDLLDRVKEMTLGAYAHQDVPFARVIQEVRPERHLNWNPLFQVVFQMLNLPPVGTDAKSADPPQLEVHRGASVCDLTCTVWETGNAVNAHVEYSTELFDAATIERFVAHYRNLLGSIAADPEQEISRLPLLAPEERLKLAQGGNPTPKCAPREEPLTEIFEHRARRRANDVAVIEGDAVIRFGDLNRRANQLAHYLRACAVGPETIVGIWVDRSIDAIVAVLAVLKTAGAFLALDESSGVQRVVRTLGDARAQTLITKSGFAQFLAGRYPGRLIALDSGQSQIAAQSDADPGLAAVPGSLACVISTSGSMGRPRAVALEHRQILSRLAWMWERYPFGPEEVCCQKTSLNFVDAIWEIFGPLLKGVPIVVAPDAALRDPRDFAELLACREVTRIWLVPSVLRMLLRSVPDLQDRLPRLRFWVSTGEPLTTDLLRTFRERMPQASLFNLYGTSETWDATWYDTRRLGESAARPPVGSPIDFARCYILDSDHELIPAGVTGELCVAGAGVARGYVNDPSLTAERFVPDSNSTEPGARMFRTGDLARLLADGSIEVLGRADEQVKIRGYRVEPAEVEEALREHPAVEQAAVVPSAAGAEVFLHAHVVAYEGSRLSATELRQFVRTRVPEYMTPAQFSFKDALPLASGGKLDRRALSQERAGNAQPAGRLEVPASPTEEILASIWRAVLNTSSVGVQDTFFDAGGHSLLLVEVQRKIAAKIEGDVRIVDLFRYPTIRSLASFLDAAAERTVAGGASWRQ